MSKINLCSDDEILRTVESMLGDNIKIVDCEKTSSIREEEVILINGIQVTLEGDDGAAIKKALETGEVPSCDLLNQILFRAGILSQPVRMETELSVKSSVVTTEAITVSKEGMILDERSCETKEDNFYTSSCSEIWEPIKIIPGNTNNTQIPISSTTEQTNASIPILIKKQHQKEGNMSTTPTNTLPLSQLQTGRHNSVGTDSSRSSSGSNVGTTSRPVSNISINNSNSSINTNTTIGELSSSGVLQLNSCESSSNKLASANDQLNVNKNKIKIAQSISCDSGHGEVSNSNLYTQNSTSSCCCDISSADEVDYIRQNANSPIFTTTKPQIATPSTNNLPQCSRNSSSSSWSTTKETNLELQEILRLDDNVLVYRDGNLISGPLDALIQHIVPTNNYYPEGSYIFAFLLSARLYIKPYELLAQICELCYIQQNLNDISQNADLTKFAKNLLQLLTEWIETFPYDFRDDRVMKHIKTMTQKCISIDGGLRKDVSILLQKLLTRLTALEQYEEFLERVNTSTDALELENPLTPSASSSANSTGSRWSGSSSTTTNTIDISELCPQPIVLAHQLTHIELERLSYIGPEEFVQAFAKEVPHLETCFKDIKKTKNLESYIHWFNKLSFLVASEIVKHSKKKLRARTVEYWIETARECFNIGNFNSLMAIIAGLNMSPISRLKKTWSKVQSVSQFSILEHQMDPSSNFTSYRSTLKAAMWRSAGATDERQRIVIPFFSLLVKDLYFLNEGCSNKLPNGHINFEKFWQLSKQVQEFIAWKQVTCPFEKVNKIIIYLQTCDVLSENVLAMSSYECEQPDNSIEKDRYKTLKTEQKVEN